MLKLDAGTILTRENHQTQRVRNLFMELKMAFELDYKDVILFF